MPGRIIVFLLIVALTVGICSSLSAKDKRNAKTKPVEVSSSCVPTATRVAVLPLINVAPEKKYVKEEIDQSLVTAHDLIVKSFADKGFRVIVGGEQIKTVARLDAATNNGPDLAKQLNADMVVDCSIKELYTFVSGSFVQRLAGVAVINVKVYDAKNGYLINDDFLGRRDSPPGILGWATKNSEMRERALKGVVSVAFDGLLRHYADAPVAPEIILTASETEKLEPSTNKQQQDISQTEKASETPEAMKVEAPVTPPAPAQPQVTKGPSYITDNGYALVPLKSIAEWLEASLDFDKQSKVIVLKTESKTLSLKLNSDVASVDGKLVQLQIPATERNGTTYVPLRFVGEAFGAKIKLDSATGEISIENSSGSAVLILSK